MITEVPIVFLENDLDHSYRKYTIGFNLGCMIAVLVLPVIPILMLWLVASCVLYAFLIGYPNQEISHYTRIAGYRFYGAIGVVAIMASFTQHIYFIPATKVPVWMLLWVLSVLAVVPLSIRDILSLKKSL
ncbi:hypothetical protein [Methyloradius palustris]|uniref:hypothetical protein n=1 Tax=Methyloradius palustris TaxID=2778876 RepID=UPI001C8C31AC|nr:hypothetical protein [Methyloradius palustris]